jgi:tRNA(Ile)-lysidine synthase
LKWEKERFAVIKRVRETLRCWPMFEGGDLVLLAVSGGGDSLVLLDVMVQLAGEKDLSLRVVHVDHGLRPESGEDALFVSEVAAHYGLPCGVVEVEVDTLDGRLSPEEAAREARYSAFREELEKSGARRLATGHTADDRIETLLLRLISGAGPRGLAAIPPVRLPFIRPLIQVWRKEVEDYAGHLPFKPRLDRSNLDTSIPRNRVRHELLPLLEREYNPAVRRVLAREADVFSSLVELLDVLAEEAEAEEVHHTARGVEMEVEGLLAHPTALRQHMIARILRELGLEPDFDLVEDIRRGLLEKEGNARLDLSKELTARRVYHRLVLGPRPVQAPPEETIIPAEGRYYLPLPGADLDVSVIPRGEEDPRETAGDPSLAWLDADSLSFPLKVRGVHPGDRFHPLGAPGSRKLQDFLVDLKIPREDRGRVALLTCGDEIAWVLGMRIDERFKVTEDTTRVVVLRVTKGEEGE